MQGVRLGQRLEIGAHPLGERLLEDDAQREDDQHAEDRQGGGQHQGRQARQADGGIHARPRLARKSWMPFTASKAPNEMNSMASPTTAAPA